MNTFRFLFIVALSLTTLNAMGITPDNLRCEYVVDPIAVQPDGSPRLSWVVNADAERGAVQSAYRIVVASSIDALDAGNPDLWDSGKTNSNKSIGIEYAGLPLKSFDKAFWRVMLWDDSDKPGEWSKTANWQMGALKSDDWNQAQWIALRDHEDWLSRWNAQKEIEARSADQTAFPLRNYGYWSIWDVVDSVADAYDPSPLLRREFMVGKNIKQAVLYICGLGYFEASINGRAVSDDVLNPAWTNYDRMALYSTYDVTELLTPGCKNAIGVMLGRGQYNPLANDGWKLNRSNWVDQPKLIAMIRVEYADGSSDTIATDRNWRVSPGPIVYDDTRIGEVYDARLEQKGWDKPGFDESKWQIPYVQDGPTEALASQMMPPVRRFAPYAPVRVFDKGDNRTVYDFGQNIAGWTRVKARGPRGAKIWVEYTECPTDSTIVTGLHPGRFVMTGRVKDPVLATFHDATTEVRQQNGYIMRGDNDCETFECHFSYKGYRYARVSTDPGVEILSIESVPVHTDLTVAGRFECGDSMINRLQYISQITMLNNFVGIPTDCPHREKQGWTADAYMTAEAAIYNFDMAQFYAKWCQDLINSQSPSGAGCTVAPSFNYDNDASLVWPAAIVYVPENLYDYYGDRRLLKHIYPSQRAFADNMRLHESKSKSGYVNEVLGDWVSPLDTILPTLKGSSLMAPPEGTRYYGSVFYCDVLGRMKRLSNILGNSADHDYYTQWLDTMRVNVNNAFYHPDEKTYYGENPTGYRLAANVVALDNDIPDATERKAVSDNLLRQICRNDYKMRTGFLGTRAMIRFIPDLSPETALRMVTQPSYPGWMYMLANGATTVWEDWNASASLDHLPYTLVSQYFFKNLGGIRLTHDENGNATIVLNPYFNSTVGWANAEYDSVYGTITSKWVVDGDVCSWGVTIPGNQSAKLCFPTDNIDLIRESGTKLAETKGLNVGDDGVITAQAGTYNFTFPIQ